MNTQGALFDFMVPAPAPQVHKPKPAPRVPQGTKPAPALRERHSTPAPRQQATPLAVESKLEFKAGHQVTYGTPEPWVVLENLGDLLKARCRITGIITFLRAESCQIHLEVGSRVFVRAPHQAGRITAKNPVAFWVEFDRTRLGCWYTPDMIFLLEGPHA